MTQTNKPDSQQDKTSDTEENPKQPKANSDQGKPKEIGGRDGPDPTRFGDWEKGGRCIDF